MYKVHLILILKYYTVLLIRDNSLSTWEEDCFHDNVNLMTSCTHPVEIKEVLRFYNKH